MRINCWDDDDKTLNKKIHKWFVVICIFFFWHIFHFYDSFLDFESVFNIVTEVVNVNSHGHRQVLNADSLWAFRF